MSALQCQSCGTPFKGKYCYNCSEKRLESTDFSLSKFFSNALDAFTHFDGKFFLTMKYLLFYPGKLTVELINGRKVKLMKPVQLYIVIAICFFLIFKNWDLFFTRTQYMVLQKPKTEKPIYYKESDLNGNQLLLKNYIAQKAKKQGLTFEQMVFKIDAKTPELSKAFIFLIIPISALFLYITGFKKYKYYTQHLFHATHIFTFYLAAAVIWIGSYILLVKYAGFNMDYNWAFAPVFCFLIIYSIISIKRLYQDGWLKITGRALVFLLGAIFSAVIYNQFITYFSVWLA